MYSYSVVDFFFNSKPFPCPLTSFYSSIEFEWKKIASFQSTSVEKKIIGNIFYSIPFSFIKTMKYMIFKHFYFRSNTVLKNVRKFHFPIQFSIRIWNDGNMKEKVNMSCAKMDNVIVSWLFFVVDVIFVDAKRVYMCYARGFWSRFLSFFFSS